MTKPINKPHAGHIAVPGGRVWYEMVGQDRPGVPVLVLQGGPGAPHDYMRPLAVLADERPVVFYDQLGAGKADRPADASLWRVERFVEELSRVWQALGWDQAHILGHSWGGMLAVDFALTRPEGLASLILDNAPLSIPRRIQDVIACRLGLPADVRAVLDQHEAAGTISSEAYQAALELFYQRHLCRLSPWPDALVRAFVGLNPAIYETMQGPSELVWTGNLRDYDRTPRLHELAVPTLFLSGRHGLVPPDTAAWFQSLLPGSELVVFEQSAELPFMEEPERYFRIARDFMRRVELAH